MPFLEFNVNMAVFGQQGHLHFWLMGLLLTNTAVFSRQGHFHLGIGTFSTEQGNFQPTLPILADTANFSCNSLFQPQSHFWLIRPIQAIADMLDLDYEWA